MKKIVFTTLVFLFLLCTLSACGHKSPNVKEPTDTTEIGYEENVFETAPTAGSDAQKQDSTSATENQTNASGKPTDGQQSTTTQPTEGQQSSTTDPTQTPNTDTTPPTTSDSLDAETLALAAEYEAYSQMSSPEKEAYRGTFANYIDFFEWYNSALAAYKAANPPTMIDPNGNITLN